MVSFFSLPLPLSRLFSLSVVSFFTVSSFFLSHLCSSSFFSLSACLFFFFFFFSRLK